MCGGARSSKEPEELVVKEPASHVFQGKEETIKRPYHGSPNKEIHNTRLKMAMASFLAFWNLYLKGFLYDIIY